MIDTVFFDWGGVIAGDPADDFLFQLLRDIGATEHQVQSIYHGHLREFMRGAIKEADFWDLLRRKYDLAIDDTISEEFVKWRGLETDPQVMQLVADVKAAGKKIAIFSNVIEPTYNALQQAGRYDGFDAVIASCQVGYNKPEPEIYQLALDKLQTTAERSLFIDDKQRNLDPAAAMGFATILARSPQQIVDDTRGYLV